MCPSSVLRTSTPSVNRAEPTPVPKVSISTEPSTPLPAPNVISATPAASASFSSVTPAPSALSNSPAASVSIHDLSTFAAERTVPPITTPGKVAPTGPVQPNDCTTSRTTSVTASGVAGCGVGIFLPGCGQLPRFQVYRRALDPRAADVNPERLHACSSYLETRTWRVCLRTPRSYRG